MSSCRRSVPRSSGVADARRERARPLRRAVRELRLRRGDPPGIIVASLGLAVEKRGNGLLVSWDGNAPIVSKANFGMLLIRGSGVSRDVPLTTDELRAGGSVYTLASDELRFQLNIVAGEQVARNS